MSDNSSPLDPLGKGSTPLDPAGSGFAPQGGVLGDINQTTADWGNTALDTISPHGKGTFGNALAAVFGGLAGDVAMGGAGAADTAPAEAGTSTAGMSAADQAALTDATSGGATGAGASAIGGSAADPLLSGNSTALDASAADQPLQFASAQGTTDVPVGEAPDSLTSAATSTPASAGASADSTIPNDPFGGSMDLGQTGTGEGTFGQYSTGDPGNIDIQSGSPGNPVQATAPTITDKLLSTFSNPTNDLAIGGLGLNIYSQVAANKAKKQAADQLNTIAKPTSDVSNSLLAQYQAGTIPAGTQFDIDTWQKQQTAAVKSQYASAGQSNSSAERNALAQISSQAESMKNQALQGLLTGGLQAAGVSQGPLTQAVAASTAQNKDLMSSQSAALNALMLLQAMQRGQAGKTATTPTATADTTDTTDQ